MRAFVWVRAREPAHGHRDARCEQRSVGADHRTLDRDPHRRSNTPANLAHDTDMTGVRGRPAASLRKDAKPCAVRPWWTGSMAVMGDVNEFETQTRDSALRPDQNRSVTPAVLPGIAGVTEPPLWKTTDDPGESEMPNWTVANVPTILVRSEEDQEKQKTRVNRAGLNTGSF